MRLVRALVGGSLAVALLAPGSPARGTVFHVETTLSISMLMKNVESPAMEFSGTGVATIQANGTDIQSLRLDSAGITHASVIVPLTDPVAGMTVVSLRGISVSVGSGTLSPIDDTGSLVANALPVRGTFLVCILMVGCQSNIPLLTAANATSGIGIGGDLITISGYGNAALQLSIQANPWTIATATATGRSGEDLFVHQFHGFVHGPASNTTSAARHDGVVQLVSPVQVTTTIIGEEQVPFIAELRVRITPEPSSLLLLGSGAIGLGMLGRRRRRAN